MFFKHSSNGKIVILIIYVDDIILTSDNEAEMIKLKNALSREFKIKDLGTLRYFHGMEVAQTSSGISVSQRNYVFDLLEETGTLECRPTNTPMEQNGKLRDEEESPSVDKGQYQRLVGKLIYLSHTRLDIAFLVSVVSQFMHAPIEEHLNAVHRILQYLKMTLGNGLFFGKSTRRGIEVYSDADWVGSVNDRRSTSGYCTYVWGNLVAWRSKKQFVVTRSSAEAECWNIALGVCEGLWLKRVMEELKISTEFPMKMFCDNQASISISHNPVRHDRTKHVKID